MVEAAVTLPEELAVVLGDELSLNDALGALGRYSVVEREGARPYLERALAILEATLGAVHPTTGIVRGNLAGLENNE